MSLHVLEPGLLTLIVDNGRPRTRSLGMAIGGAADRFSFHIGNALVGNPPNTPALEIGLVGPTLEAECDLACVLTGGNCDAFANGRKITVNKTFTLSAGHKLEIRGFSSGMRGYLCLAGGIGSRKILGSYSSIDPLQQGQKLECSSTPCRSRFLHPGGDDAPRKKSLEEVALQQWLPFRRQLRIVDGPQADWFSNQLEILTTCEFTIGKDSNRMGVRLQGKPLVWPDQELVSEPVVPGAIQVTNDGQYVILGVDGQTIGGYPKIGVVIDADLDCLAQLRPGDAIRFSRVSMTEAEELCRKRRKILDYWCQRIETSWFGVNAP